MTKVIPAFVVAAVLLALVWGANRSAFFPSRFPAGEWASAGALGTEDVWLQTEDGVKLHSWWLPTAGASWVTLYLHGNAGNISHRGGKMKTLGSAGAAVLLPDYRGYGKSEGKPSEAGLYRDAMTAYAYLRSSGWPADRIVLYGESLGTAVAVELGAREQCAGVILEAPFPSARAVANAVLPVLGPLLVWGWDTADRIRRLRSPLLVMHGDRDEVIPIRLGRRVYEAAPEPKTFWIVPGAGHNDLVERAGAEFTSRLREFHQSLASRTTEGASPIK